MHKLKSVKLWLTVALIAFTGFLNYSGAIKGADYLDFIKWALGVYVVGNVGAKAANKLEVKSKG